MTPGFITVYSNERNIGGGTQLAGPLCFILFYVCGCFVCLVSVCTIVHTVSVDASSRASIPLELESHTVGAGLKPGPREVQLSLLHC